MMSHYRISSAEQWDSISAALAGVSVTADIKQRKTFRGGTIVPLRGEFQTPYNRYKGTK